MVIIHVNFHENKILLTHFREILACQNRKIKYVNKAFTSNQYTAPPENQVYN